MDNEKPIPFVPLTPAAQQILRELEIRRQSFLDGVLAASGFVGGAWSLAADGSGLTRSDK